MTIDEALERLEAMIEDDPATTWDHSPNDVEAFRVVATEMRRMRRVYSLFEELSPPDVPRPVFVELCFKAWGECVDNQAELLSLREQVARAKGRHDG
jgi:hypothetical protein